MLAVGPRLGEMTTGGYTLLKAPRPQQKLVHVHAGAEELGRVYAADLMLQASMAAAGKALETLAPPTEIHWTELVASGERRLRGEPGRRGGRAARHGARS